MAGLALSAMVLAAPAAAAASDGGGHAGMVLVPAGPFTMGADARDGRVGVQIGVDSVPRHEVNVKAFWIDRNEVTHEQYQPFVAATGRKTPVDPKFGDFYAWSGDEFPPGLANHPVVYVDWTDADAYCRSIGKRLPTEAEWEKAARGTDGRTYPWGEGIEPDWCNTKESEARWTTPVGTMTHDESPYGVMDMCGNVSEWTDTWYQAYPGSTLERNAFGQEYKAVRGGSWLLRAEPFARVTHRTLAFKPSKRHRAIGFRCAQDAVPGDAMPGSAAPSDVAP
jgi:formylglycine-generating enzyme required for sulfatase activity